MRLSATLSPMGALALGALLLGACASEEAASPSTGDATSTSASSPSATGTTASGTPAETTEGSPPPTDSATEESPSTSGPPWPPYGVGYDPYADGLESPECATYGALGPFDVGVVTIQVGDVLAEVWYPADPEGERPEGRDFYDMREWLPEDDREKIPDDQVPLFVTAAWREITPSAEGPFPLVLFSHGLSGYRMQSSAFTAHLASWGMVVASRDHASRTLEAVLGGNFGGFGEAETMSGLRDEVLALAEDPEHLLFGLVDGSFVAASGHSAGAGSTAGTVDEGGIDAAIYLGGQGAPEEPVNIPQLAMAGTRDRVVTPVNTRRSWENMGEPRTWVLIKDAGHLAFSDICLVGRDQGGLLAVAQENGITVNLLIRNLSQDGCRERDLPAEEAWPIIHHASTALLLNAAGVPDAEALDVAALTECFGALIDEAVTAP